MAQQTINIGASPNDGTGTPLRTAFQYTNSNFSELYTAVGPSGNNIVVPGSATITGDLTVDTSTLKVDSANNRVGIRTASPAEPLTVDNSSGVTTGAIRIYAIDQSHSRLSIQNGNGQAYHLVAGNPGASNAGFALYDNTGAATRWYVDNTGVHTWQNVGGVAGTAMTLNSTGLGVGGSPSYKLDVQGTSAGVLRLVNILNLSTDPAAVTRLSLDGQGATWHLDNERTNGIFKITRNSTACLTIDNSANVGIGVTPSATDSTYYQALEIARVGQGLTCVKTAFTSTPNSWLSNNSYATYSAGTVWKYAVSSQSAVQYRLAGGEHQWFTAPNSGVSGAGTNITFTERLRLKETGQLRFIPLAADPSGAEAGDVYYNSSSNKLKCYNGTTWNDLF